MRHALRLLAAASFGHIPISSHASDWEDVPAVQTVDEAKALPEDTRAVTVNSSDPDILEELAKRDTIEALNITHSGEVGHLKPLKKMSRLYSLSVRTGNTRDTFEIISELRDLRSFHLRVH